MRFDFDESDRGQVAGIVRLGKNVPIQGSSADIIKRAMTLLDESLVEIDARIVNSVHDELVVECAEDVTEEARERVEHCMETAGRDYIKSIPVVIESVVAESWIK